ncbi:MAG: lytic transglycosylase domain-containing protein [Caulobacteraceae bacterium]
MAVSSRIAVVSLFAVCASLASTARGQVMELGENGAVKTYSGPMVFDAQGATPIVTAPKPIPRVRQRAPIRADIARAADGVALSPALLRAVAERESGFRTNVVSRAGAIGEMQLMPATAKALGVDPTDAGQNLKGGAAYLSKLMRRYDGDLMRSLAAYNAGPGAVDRYGGIPPFKETQAYVAAIMQRLSLDAMASGASEMGK